MPYPGTNDSTKRWGDTPISETNTQIFSLRRPIYIYKEMHPKNTSLRCPHYFLLHSQHQPIQQNRHIHHINAVLRFTQIKITPPQRTIKNNEPRRSAALSDKESNAALRRMGKVIQTVGMPTNLPKTPINTIGSRIKCLHRKSKKL